MRCAPAIPFLLSITVACLAHFGSIQAQTAALPSARFVPAKAPDQQEGRVSDYAHIRIDGEITTETPRQFSSALLEARRQSPNRSFGGQQLIFVFLDTPGGNVGAAVTIGRMLRANAANVWVDKGATCSSACIFVLAGGIDRWAVPGAKLGLHRPYFEQKMFAGLSYEAAQKLYGRLSSAVQTYLIEMGITADLYEMMIRIPSDDLLELDHDLAERTNLLGKDPAYEEWDRARYQQLVVAYEKCLRQGKPEIDCQTQFRPKRSHQ